LLLPHLAAVGWGVYVEFAAKICPLTPLEKWLRLRAGQTGYRGEFIEHYLLPVLYPAGLTRDIQLVLGFAVIFINFGAYFFIYRKWERGR
jgi:hypothetical protein